MPLDPAKWETELGGRSVFNLFYPVQCAPLCSVKRLSCLGSAARCLPGSVFAASNPVALLAMCCDVRSAEWHSKAASVWEAWVVTVL